jgi:hypothetical protein
LTNIAFYLLNALSRHSALSSIYPCVHLLGLQKYFTSLCIYIYKRVSIRTTSFFLRCQAVYQSGLSRALHYSQSVSALRRANAEVKYRWSVNGMVTKNLLSRPPPCFGKYVKPLVPAAFAVVSTNPPNSTGSAWRVLAHSPYV